MIELNNKAKPRTKTSTCYCCGVKHPVSDYGVTPKGRISRICTECTAKRKAQVLLPKWDWANAMSKYSGMRSVHSEKKVNPVKQKDEKAKFTEYSPILTHETLRTLMDYQRERCALTGRVLYLPKGSELKTRQTLTKWCSKLSPDNFARTPVLVRLDKLLPWEPGNVMFIMRAWRDLYESCTSYAEFISMLQDMRNKPMQIPGYTELTKMALKRVEQRMVEANPK